MSNVTHEPKMSAAEAESRLDAQVSRLKGALASAAASGREFAHDLARDEGWVGEGVRCARKHPVAAVAIAAGVGLLLSRILR